MAVELLLLSNVDKLGKSGEVVKVSAGYARNYLLPRHLAVQATKGIVAVAEEMAKNRQQQLKKALEEIQKLKEKIETLECLIPVKVGKEDKIFGSVTNADIAKSLDKQSVQLDRRKIVLKEPIKSLGDYSVSIKLHPEVEASLKVRVVRQ